MPGHIDVEHGGDKRLALLTAGLALKALLELGGPPQQIVYNEDTCWDDVNDCSHFFKSHERMRIAFDPQLYHKLECLTFFTRESFDYFLPLFIINATLMPTSEAVEVADGVCSRLAARLSDETPLLASRSLREMILSFTEWLPSLSSEFTGEAARIRTLIGDA